MNKYTKKDYTANIILVAVYLVIIAVITRGTFLFGSSKDWVTQHTAFAGYFRMMYFENNDFFPQFALNIGAGENIFYYSYYGLFSPLVVVSYLFKSVPMTTFMSVSMIVTVIASVLFFYRWLKRRYSTQICIIGALIFELAPAITFHSHRHIMFISYMPFMILALFGVERFFKKKRPALLVISVFMMIMSSYYFSVSAILWLTLYAIAYRIDTDKGEGALAFIKDGIKYATAIITGCMMSGILLVPTLFVLLNGRQESNGNVQLIQMLLPNFNRSIMFYDHYSLGMTAIFMVAVIFNIMYKDKGKKFLAICMALLLYFGIFTYALNGFMYLNGKIFIPMIPIAVELIAVFFDEITKKEVDIKKFFVAVLIGHIPALYSKDLVIIAYAFDLVIMLLLIYHTVRKKNIKVLAYVTCFIMLCICMGFNLSDKLVKKDSFYISEDKNLREAAEKIIEENMNYYRASCNIHNAVNTVYVPDQLMTGNYSSAFNVGFGQFVKNEICSEDSYRNSLITSVTENPVYNMYIGNRYIFGRECDMKGYTESDIDKYVDLGNVKVYENEDAMPIGYATDKYLSLDNYKELTYPYNVMALCKYAVLESPEVTKSVADVIHESNICKWEYGSIDNCDTDGFLVPDGTGMYDIDIDESETIIIPVDKKLADKVFFIKTKVVNDQHSTALIESDEMDVVIDINGVTNKLSDPDWRYNNGNYSFEYTISSNDLTDKLVVEFGPGKYKVSDFEIYYTDYKELVNNKNIDELDIVTINSGDNVLEGFIDCDKEKVLVLTIPYDEGMSILVDDKEAEIMTVDTAFSAVKVEEGCHNIKVKFEAPGFKIGVVVSVVGIILFVLIVCISFLVSRKYINVKQS